VIVLDTNVVSEPLKLKPDVDVMGWLSAQAPESLFVTTITVAEMLVGVEKMPQGRKRAALLAALNEQVWPLFAGRVLSFDVPSATAFSKVIVATNAVGNDIDFANAAIAAISIANGFHLATRNVRDFRGVKLELMNPWSQAN
jgi:toxin FitB